MKIPSQKWGRMRIIEDDVPALYWSLYMTRSWLIAAKIETREGGDPPDRELAELRSVSRLCDELVALCAEKGWTIPVPARAPWEEGAEHGHGEEAVHLR